VTATAVQLQSIYVYLRAIPTATRSKNRVDEIIKQNYNYNGGGFGLQDRADSLQIRPGSERY